MAKIVCDTRNFNVIINGQSTFKILILIFRILKSYENAVFLKNKVPQKKKKKKVPTRPGAIGGQPSWKSKELIFGHHYNTGYIIEKWKSAGSWVVGEPM